MHSSAAATVGEFSIASASGREVRYVPVPASDVRLTLTSGAVDAVERLLAQALLRDDAVALEDPCFLASIHLAQLGGYRAVPVAVDAEGMTVEGLRHALDQGVRAVVCTPRAQNPTGSSLSAARAAALREVLADHPYVLVIQDDYFSYLSQQPFHSIVGPDHRRWALVRSVSKFVGPDMCLAVTACDADTAARLLDVGHRITLLPNTAGCYTAQDAVRTCRLARIATKRSSANNNASAQASRGAWSRVALTLQGATICRAQYQIAAPPMV